MRNTCSLGAHTVMHYYRYARSSDSALSGDEKARSIDPAPVLSLLLEPRSLVITTDALYTAHLHGIGAVHADTFPAPGTGGASGVRIANAELLRDEEARAMVQEGGTLVRATRYSLTCRDVARVAGAGTGRLFGRR